jgi:hypothetical protein
MDHIVDNIKNPVLLMRHTNRTKSESDYINPNEYPAQLNIVGTKVKLKYRNHYIIDKNLLDVEPYIIDKETGERVYSRPADDYPFIHREPGPDDDDYKDIYEEDFLVLRADAEAPFRLVAVNDNYTIMLVNSTKGNPSGYDFETLVAEYPIQIAPLIGAKINIRYRFNNPDNISREGYVLISDSTESMYGVYIEIVVNENSPISVRYLFDDEVIALLSEEEYKKVIDATIENNLEQIAEVRRNILEQYL